MPEAKDWIKSDLLRQTKSEIVDGKRKVRVLDADGNPTADSLDDLVRNTLDNKRMAPFVIASKATGSGATGRGGSAAVKEMKRSEFHQLPHAERHQFMKDGGKLTD